MLSDMKCICPVIISCDLDRQFYAINDPVTQATRNYVSPVVIGAGMFPPTARRMFIPCLCEPTFAPTIDTLEFSARAFNLAYIPKPQN
jgi:hypothetical protein